MQVNLKKMVAAEGIENLSAEVVAIVDCNKVVRRDFQIWVE